MDILNQQKPKRTFTKRHERVYFYHSLLKFDNCWNDFQRNLLKLGNPNYVFTSDVNLTKTNVKDLGNIKYVIGNLYLDNSEIISLGTLSHVTGNLDMRKTKINTLNYLQKVDGYLDLQGTKIKNLGKLRFVGGWLNLEKTPMSKKYTIHQIREMVEVTGEIFL